MVKEREDIEESFETDLEDYTELDPLIKNKLEWFKDQKLGIIFHWGLYSVAGIVESWQLSEEDEWARNKPWRNDIEELREDYWGLVHSFNPYKFNPDEWATICKQAGFRYMLFTTKHHDGFNMYDTQFSEFKVTGDKCPYASNPKADIFKAVATAFRNKGMHVGAYYSKADWYAPDYWADGERPKGRYASYCPLEKPEVWAKYNQFVANQLGEIVSNYGRLDIVWLDGGWINKNEEQLDMVKIVQKVRKQQPDLLIVDRTIGGQYENYVTPERKIPKVAPKKAWESNIPLANNWGFCPNDTYKAFTDIVTSFVKIVSLGGNLVLGVGPKPDGSLPRESVQVLTELGTWLEQYGEAIYHTRPCPVPQLDGWLLTRKDKILYAFHNKNALNCALNLETFTEKIKSVVNLSTGEELQITGTIDLQPHTEIYQLLKIEFS